MEKKKMRSFDLCSDKRQGFQLCWDFPVSPVRVAIVASENVTDRVYKNIELFSSSSETDMH